MGFLTSSWIMNLCGSPVCSSQDVLSCALNGIFDSSTCTNHLVAIGIGVLLILVLTFQLLVKIPKSRASMRQFFTLSSPLQLAAVLFSGCLGLVYLGLGLSMLGNIFNQDASVYLPHWWLVTLSQGFSLICSSFAFSIRPRFLGASFVQFLSVLVSTYAAFICCSSVVGIVAEKTITIKACLNVLSLPGAFLFLLYGIRCSHDEEGYEGNGNALYKFLNTKADGEIADSDSQGTLLAKAGFFSKMSFWWLNNLMKMGYEKLLEDKDVPLLQTTEWLSAFLLRRAYYSIVFWSSPVLVSAATFLTCYLLKIPLDASNVFTTVATLRLVQEPVRSIPIVIAVAIQAKVAFTRISKFLDAPELNGQVRKKYRVGIDYPIVMNSCSFSWDENPSKPTLNNINLVVKAGEKIAICGEVGSGKSMLLAAVLGEVPKTEGTIQVCGRIAYVSQTAWIQTGTVQDNILFGSLMDRQMYQETLARCSLVKDLEMLPFGDLTQIGERGVNLSGGQKQRVQLARALYQNADIYLLDDPFSAVDAHTATSLFNASIVSAGADCIPILLRIV